MWLNARKWWLPAAGLVAFAGAALVVAASTAAPPPPRQAALPSAPVEPAAAPGAPSAPDQPPPARELRELARTTAPAAEQSDPLTQTRVLRDSLRSQAARLAEAARGRQPPADRSLPPTEMPGRAAALVTPVTGSIREGDFGRKSGTTP
jgi:hypothetical protein